VEYTIRTFNADKDTDEVLALLEQYPESFAETDAAELLGPKRKRES